METKWTPEPVEVGTYLPESMRIFPQNDPGYQTKISETFFATAKRVKTCYNELAGIPDLKEFVEAARESLKALRSLHARGGLGLEVHDYLKQLITRAEKAFGGLK